MLCKFQQRTGRHFDFQELLGHDQRTCPVLLWLTILRLNIKKGEEGGGREEGRIIVSYRKEQRRWERRKKKKPIKSFNLFNWEGCRLLIWISGSPSIKFEINSIVLRSRSFLIFLLKHKFNQLLYRMDSLEINEKKKLQERKKKRETKESGPGSLLPVVCERKKK